MPSTLGTGGRRRHRPRRQPSGRRFVAADDRRPTNEQARRVLGWTPRPPQEAIVAAAESMLDRGLAAP
ncbi:hypothetical protein [Actinomycetospora straminea]|nr:hypothetical protein [Actinomycetospora straminea]MDD7933880.1 hypothetical protein [Actinomycetospora straminea]